MTWQNMKVNVNYIAENLDVIIQMTVVCN